MANRFFNPNEQFCDATGTPYAGGSLTFYASGTTTPLNTYSDKALTIANTNPVVLDSAGRAGTIFLQNLAYKVVLEDVNLNVIWTMDPVYASDFSTVAQFLSGSGSPNGSVAGSAGSATIPASSYWDFTNQILYICTQTGTTSTAVWTAINSGSTVTSTPTPDGYLTPTSGTPIITSDVIAATNIFYTPYTGNLIPIYNGTTFVTSVFAELNLSISSLSSNGIYDIFVFSNSGVITICSGPAWSNATAGSCARGTGAGTTQLTRVNGILVNAVSMTGKNGSTSYTIAANQATYVGTIYIDATTGQITCHRTYGQNRKWGIWNTYNRVPIILKAGDPTASWTYGTGTIRASNNVPSTYAGTSYNVGSGTACNGFTILTGLAEEECQLSFLQQLASGTASAATWKIGIGVNSTTAFTANAAFAVAASNNASGTTIEARYIQTPFLGINTYQSLENANSNQTATFDGQEVGPMILAAAYRG